MITVEKLEKMDLGFKIGSEYEVLKRGKKNKVDGNIVKGIFIGQSGVNNEFIMLRSKKHNIVECFLKIDLLNGEYSFRQTL